MIIRLIIPPKSVELAKREGLHVKSRETLRWIPAPSDLLDHFAYTPDPCLSESGLRQLQTASMGLRDSRCVYPWETVPRQLPQSAPERTLYLIRPVCVTPEVI